MTDQLPIESEAQRIGYEANRCFMSNHPEEWRPHSLSGDDDFGFDYQIHVVKETKVTYIFRAQLKGTTSPQMNVAKTLYSVPLKLSTVGLYKNCSEPILLVLADLSSGRLSKECPLYYTWIHEELQRIENKEIPASQASVVFHVPVENVLTHETDLSAELDRFRRVAAVGGALDRALSKRRPGLAGSVRVDLLEGVPKHLSLASPILLDVLADEPTSSWPEASPGTLAHLLKEATELLRVGNIKECKDRLNRAIKFEADASVLESADYQFLRGRVATFESKDAEAASCFERAAALSSNLPKHVVAWAECMLRVRFEDIEAGAIRTDDIFDRLGGDAAEVIGMRARVYAAAKRFDEALSEVSGLSSVEGCAARAIIYGMQGNWLATIEACSTGIEQEHPRDSAKQLFLIMRARARFHIATGTTNAPDGNFTIPASGPSGANIVLLKKAFEDIQSAVRELRQAGWPSNTDLLVDIWTAAALILRRHEQELPLLTEACAARDYSLHLAYALETLAAHSEMYAEALAANSRQPESPGRTLRRVILLHMLKRDAECVKLFEQRGAMAPTTEPLFGLATMVAIASAERTIQPDLARSWESLFDNDSQLAERKALLAFERGSHHGLGLSEAREELRQRYEALGRPLILGINLFMSYDASDAEQAAKAMDVGNQLASERLLIPDAVVHYAQCLATLGDWSGLLEVARTAQSQFELDARFIAIEALALDKLGQSADALAILKGLLDTGTTDPVAIQTYLAIVVRCGLVEEAKLTVESIIARETDTLKRLEAHRVLFRLVFDTDPTDPRALAIAERVGRLVKQEDEEQEGLFLVLMVTATSCVALEKDDHRIIDMQSRATKFVENFPNSSIFRMANLPTDSPDELLRQLKKFADIDEDFLRWQTKTERELQRGEVPIPYSWRPRHVFGSVGDLPTLWAITKKSRPHQRQFHLSMVGGQTAAVRAGDLKAATPLLDLTTLLVLHDLGLLDLIFAFFPKIAIGQATLLEIANLLSQFGGTPFRNQCTEIRTILRNHLAQIEQPQGQGAGDEDNGRPFLPQSAEIKALAQSTRFALYTDDFVFRIYCDVPGDAPVPFNTLDVLRGMEEKGLLTHRQVAEKLALLCKWHVGINIDFRYLVAALPDELKAATSMKAATDLLRSDPICGPMFNEICDLQKPLVALVDDAIRLLRTFVAEPKSRVESVAGVLGVWFGNVQFHPDAPRPIALLAMIAVGAVGRGASVDDQVLRKKILQAYFLLVGMHHGDFMDEQREREGYSEVGLMAARVDSQNPGPGTSVRQLLRSAITDGTAESDAFDRGVKGWSDKLVEAVQASTRRS